MKLLDWLREQWNALTTSLFTIIPEEDMHRKHLFTVVVLDKEGNVQRKSIKWDRSTELAAEKCRNSVQAYWDRFYPSLGWHAQVRPLTTDYHVYNENGLYMGTHTEFESGQILQEHPEWTRTEEKK